MAIPDGGHYVASVNPVSLWLYLMVATMLPQWILLAYGCTWWWPLCCHSGPCSGCTRSQLGMRPKQNFLFECRNSSPFAMSNVFFSNGILTMYTVYCKQLTDLPHFAPPLMLIGICPELPISVATVTFSHTFFFLLQFPWCYKQRLTQKRRKSLKGSVSWDFRPPFFHDLNPSRPL